MKKLIILSTLCLCCFSVVPALGQTTSTIRGRVVDAGEGHGLRAILSNDRALLDVALDSQGKFIFEGIEPGDYVLKVNGVGYDTGHSRSLTVELAEVGNSTTEELVFQVRRLPGDGFLFQWEDDSSYAGVEYSSYVNNPVEVEILGKKETIKGQNYHQRLSQNYSVVLSDDQQAWT